VGLGEALRSWLRVRGRSAEHVSFAVRRLAGVVLALYLVVHMVDISTLLMGEHVYSAFLQVFASPIGLVFDVVLWVFLVLHGALGLYSALVEAGLLLERRKVLLAAAWAAALLLLVVGVLVILYVRG
jgi:succinate dehydrogenase / fumarate reductase cytochrome b subunit